MNHRTGKECKKINCDNYEYYSNWPSNMGQGRLAECMNCRNAFRSQYHTTRVSAEVVSEHH